MFYPPMWMKTLFDVAHPQLTTMTLELASAERVVRPYLFYPGAGGASSMITWSTCCDWEIPDSMSGGELDYRYTLDTYDIVRPGGMTEYEQSVPVVLSHLSAATIRILAGGQLPIGTYINGTLIAPIAGDLNGDESVDAGDAAILFVNWGNAGESDLNGDGITDAADAGQMFSEWTGDAGPARATPEPCTGWLLLAALCLWRGALRSR